MTDWIPQIAGRSGPRYRAIVQALSDGIRRGRLKPGDRLPTQREMARRLGVTLGTVTRAYSDAEAEGLIQGQVGRGTFVTGRGEGEAGAPSETPPDFRGYDALAGPFVDSFERALVAAAGRRAGSDGPATKPERSFHNTALRFARLRFGVKGSPQRLFGLTGEAASIAAILPALAERPAALMTAELTSDRALSAARSLGYGLHPVVEDEDGLLPESLELACWSSSAKVLFAAPDGGVPTGRVMSADRRKQLVEIARKYDIWIIEDRTGAPFVNADAPSLATLAPERTVALIHLDRAVYPDLSLTLALAAPDAAPAIRDRAPAVGARAPRLMRDVFAAWFAEGIAEDALAWQTEQGKRRQLLFRRHMQEAAEKGRIGGTGFVGWLRPSGGAPAGATAARLREAGAYRLMTAEPFWAGSGAAPRRLFAGLTSIEGLTALERHLPGLATALLRAGRTSDND